MTVKLHHKTPDGLPGDPVDLTGCTSQAQIRADFDSPDVLVEMITSVDPENGLVYLEISSTDTQNLAQGFWDMQVTFPNGWVKTYVAGTVDTTKQVTQ